jgi:predicted lipid-binding transport protein (Tim44 family)
MVLEMQRIIGQVGSASTIGRSLQWTAYGADRRRVSSRTVQVTITPRNGRTTIQIHEPMGQLAGGLFGGLMGGMGGGLSGAAVGIGMGAFHSGAAAVALVASVVSGSYLLARTIFGRMVRSRGDELQQLMSRLVDHVSATAPRVSAPDTPSIERPAERGTLERGE